MNYKPTNKTYRITTVKKLFSIMTNENLPYLMADIYKTAELMLALDEISKRSLPLSEKYSKIQLPVFEWIDDGKNDLTEVILSDKKGNTLDILDMVNKLPNDL